MAWKYEHKEIHSTLAAYMKPMSEHSGFKGIVFDNLRRDWDTMKGSEVFYDYVNSRKDQNFKNALKIVFTDLKIMDLLKDSYFLSNEKCACCRVEKQSGQHVFICFGCAEQMNMAVTAPTQAEGKN